MKFLLLLRGDPAAFEALPAGERQRIIAAHGAWAGELARAGRLVDGAGFPGRCVRFAAGGGGEVRATDVSFAGDRLAPSGFYLVDAASADEAAALARACPALAHGETVDVLPCAH